MSTFFGGQDARGAKLTEEEQKLVARLFSDPTYFPIEFRTWIRSYIQDAGITVSTSQVRGSGVGVRTGLPAGLVLPFPGDPSKRPPDTLVCDGTAYLRATENALFEKIGILWGSGGPTLFNVPDFRDRTLFGVGAAVGLAATDGHPFGSRSGWRHQHGTHFHPVGREVFSLTPGATGYSLQGFTYDLVTGAAQVGPAGTSLDGPDWAGVVYVITTGKAA